MILNAFLLFTLFGNKQKLNCLFIYFSYHVPRYFTSQKKIATSQFRRPKTFFQG